MRLPRHNPLPAASGQFDGHRGNNARAQKNRRRRPWSYRLSNMFRSLAREGAASRSFWPEAAIDEKRLVDILDVDCLLNTNSQSAATGPQLYLSRIVFKIIDQDGQNPYRYHHPAQVDFGVNAPSTFNLREVPHAAQGLANSRSSRKLTRSSILSHCRFL